MTTPLVPGTAPTAGPFPLMSPADTARGGGAPVSEIVTFRLNPGVTEAEFLRAASATEAFVRAAPGFRSRRLSAGADGLWTDHVVWAGMAEARAASEAIMTEADVAPFLGAIDPESVTMRHETLFMQME